MKKIFITLIVALTPMLVSAQQVVRIGKAKVMANVSQKETDIYMKGAVPEVDGKVVFKETITDIPANLSENDILMKAKQWAAFRYEPNTENGIWPSADYFKNRDYATTKSVEGNVITIQGDEEMVFKNVLLNKDSTRIFYTLVLTCSKTGIDVTMKNIYYVYEGNASDERLTAEVWITDNEAITKNGQGLNKISGKFRVRTIDLKNELVNEIRNTLNQ